MQLLLEKGAQVDALISDSSHTGLHLAATAGHGSVVRLLLEHEAEAEARDIDGETVLQLAGGQGQDIVMELLLDHGADVAAFDFAGLTPLQVALRQDHTTPAHLL